MYRPQVAIFGPEKSFGPDHVGLVLLNHAGSTSRSNRITRGDTVGDAQFLADNLGVTVVAADRPLSGTVFPFNPYSRHELHADTTHQYSLLNTEIDRALAATGINRVILTGRSLGGFGALELARFGRAEVVAFEPGGMQNVDLTEGKRHYQTYNKTEREIFTDKNNELLVHPPENDQKGLAFIRRAFTIARATAADTYYYADLLATDRGLQSAEFVAAGIADMRVQLVFAENSLVLFDQTAEAIDNKLKMLRSSANNPNAEEVLARTEPNTMHGSWNNRALVAKSLKPSIAYQADQPTSL